MDIWRSLRDRPDLWGLFTREEEYSEPLRDRYDRYPRFMSCEGGLLDPRVSAYLNEHGLRPKYPEGRRFAVCLSHDIDLLFEGPEAKLNESINAFARKDLRAALHHLRRMPSRTEPHWRFEDMMRLEDDYHARSTFFFMANDAAGPDANYILKDVSQVISRLAAGGWEVGLHGGFQSYLDLDRLKKEKSMLESALGRSVKGFRAHFLKIRMPDTWEMLAKAGFTYDSTLGYPDCIGFRSGMCHPYRPFNLRTRSWIDIHEIPLVIMDTTLVEYMRLDAVGAWEAMKDILEKVERCSGAISILWHNSSFRGEMLDLYERLLKHCLGRDAWLVTAEELLGHWQANQYFSYSPPEP